MSSLIFPKTGWMLDGIFVHTRHAYIHASDWFVDFEARFPDKAKRMRNWTEASRFGMASHRAIWLPVIVSYLNKNGERR